jgi:Tol biopolymer transport system component
LDTGQLTVLPLKLLQISGYDWSPDERTLVAQATDLQGRYGIHLIDVSTGTTTPVAIANDETRYVQPQWATVGRTVFYLKSPRGIRTGQMLARNLDTKEEREFMDGAPFRTNDGAVLGPAGTLSPDGLSRYCWWIARRCCPDLDRLSQRQVA